MRSSICCASGACSRPSRSPVPAQADHPFRPKPIIRSGPSRSPIPGQTDQGLLHVVWAGEQGLATEDQELRTAPRENRQSSGKENPRELLEGGVAEPSMQLLPLG